MISILFAYKLKQISSITIFPEGLSKAANAIRIYIPHSIGHLFDARDLEPLPFLNGLDELTRLKERLMGPGIQPGKSPAQKLNTQCPHASDTHE